MSTFGWVLILFGFITGMSAARGRGVSTFVEDMGDLVTAAVSGDYDTVREVLDRRGESLTPTLADPGAAASTVGGAVAEGVTGGSSPGPGAAAASEGSSATGVALLAEVVKLGTGKTYVLGSTGPNSYDCSSLVWRAMQNVMGYKGPRWTTATWKSVAASIGAVQVSSPAVGDIAWWPGHVGIVDDPSKGTYFSARSPKYGINSASIETTRTSRGASKTEYWRIP